MKCKTCGHEIDEPKFIKVKLDGRDVYIEDKIHDFNIAFKDIIIPKGLRLLTAKEAIDLMNMPNVIEKINGKEKGTYIQQFIKQNKGKFCATAWLGCNSRGFLLDAINNLDNNNAARGVLFARDIKEAKQ